MAKFGEMFTMTVECRCPLTAMTKQYTYYIVLPSLPVHYRPPTVKLFHYSNVCAI